MVYGCDAPWWKHRHGLPEFKGLKVCYADSRLNGYPDIRRIEIEKTNDRILLGKIGRVGGGGNSGFHAVNLVVQFGARRILLVGFDMTDRGGVHWYGRNSWPMANNPMQSNFVRWLAAFEAAAPTLAAIGVEIVNCSPTSAMKTFPRRSIADALKGWV